MISRIEALFDFGQLVQVYAVIKYSQSWASADFFPGEGKIFQGGAKTYYLPKKHLKTYYFL